MEPNDSKQNARNQYIALTLVVFGATAAFVGCQFHFTELTTAATGIIGAGLGMLTNQHSNNSLRAAGSIAVNSSPAEPAE
jgi:hypothetical protein